MQETLTHRLVLPEDTNHYGTLYAGALLRLALEAAYVTAYRLVGPKANLVLRRVVSLECNAPVPMGAMIEIRGIALHASRAYMVIGLIGSPLADSHDPWMDGLMGFAQVGADGRPTPLPGELSLDATPADDWTYLRERLDKLLRQR